MSSSSSFVHSRAVDIVRDTFGRSTSSSGYNGWTHFFIAQQDIPIGAVLSSENYPFVLCEKFKNDDLSLGLILKATAEQLEGKSVNDSMVRRSLRICPNYSIERDSRMTQDASICISNAVPLRGPNFQFSDSLCVHRPSPSNNAVGVYLTLGLMPHSCAPNTSHHISADGTLVTRASRRILRGDVITRSWMNQLYSPYTSRQRVFAQLFGNNLICQCEICARSTVLTDSNNNNDINDRLLHQFLDSFLRNAFIKECSKIQKLEEREAALLSEWKLTNNDDKNKHAHASMNQQTSLMNLHKEVRKESDHLPQQSIQEGGRYQISPNRQISPSRLPTLRTNGHLALGHKSLAAVERLIALMEFSYHYR